VPVAVIKQNGLGVVTDLAALASELLGEVRDEGLATLLGFIADNPKTVMTIKGLKNSVVVMVTKRFGALGVVIDTATHPPFAKPIVIPPNIDPTNFAAIKGWVDGGFQTNPDGTAIIWSPRMGTDP
jgi:hypothetical protein